ncbi:InlB B-repeat-containing protein [Parabacteroides sp.]
MKKRYLKNMTARVTALMLSFLCLAGSQAVVAQSLSMGGGASSIGSSLSGNIDSNKNKFHSPMTKSGETVDITVNGISYTDWDSALTAINQSAETNFDIVLNADLTVGEMPAKACVFSSSDPADPKTFHFYNSNNTGNEYRMSMQGAVAFKNIKLNIFQIVANGHTLTFDEGTDCSASGYTNNGQNSYTGICNVWGGGNTENVENTNIIIKSGQFGWVYGGSGSTGAVTGTAKITMSGGTINGSIFGGGYNGSCGNTEVVMSGGTTCWIYGGGEIGDVTGTSKLTISNTAVVTENIFGGSDSGTCGNTEVNVSGGTFAYGIYGGGFIGQVTGLSKVIVTGGDFSGTIYGGGFGKKCGQGDSRDANLGKVGSTEVHVSGLTNGEVSVYGGGLYADVTGNTQVTINTGKYHSIYGSGHVESPYNPSHIGGDVTVTFNDGETRTLGAVNDQIAGASDGVVAGSMNIVIKGGTVTTGLQSGNLVYALGNVYESCTLMFDGVGNESAPYVTPMIEGFTDIVLNNSVVSFKEPQTTGSGIFLLHGFSLDPAHPVNISGNGKLIGTGILLHIIGKDFSTNTPLVVASNLPKTTTFAKYVKLEAGSAVTSPVYKAGNTYRVKKDSETLYTVKITEPDRKFGTLSVVWDKFKEQDVELEDGDQAPANTQLTVTVTPADAGIAAILKNNGQTITSGEKLTLSADADITVETEIQPLDLSQRSDDVTISKDGDAWKYTEAAITRTATAAVSFNGTIKNTLADGKRMLIDNTAQGVLIFESAKINSTSTAAPALTIENGANVSFSGSLEVKTGNADQYGILNNGNLTITGTSTTITSTNTDGSSDKGIQVGNGAVIVSETGTTLTTSGLSNEGTVVVKEGAEAKTEGGQDLQKTYLVMIADPGNGHTFTVKAGDIEIKSNDKVADKTILTVQAIPANGYRLETITATPKDGQAVTLANNGTYVMPENEVTFKATFKSTYVPPVPTYYTVTLPEVEGVTTNPKAGMRTVEEGYSFSFTLTLHEGYESSRPVVKANGIVVEPRESDGKYIIRNIEEDTEITIEGIIKDDPTGNATIEGEIKVQAIGSTLHIYLPKAETVSVYTLSGLLYGQQDLSAGSTQMQLGRGMYLVKIGEKTYKIVIR